ncbi:MAG: hypothetical protein RBG1_1C00001G0693 [candidate division Zixibacteria bacterium RBG-1]|nr:MAG: hypothetical protein RBG1_1C00001G0693 [candidate division Zixibacteria bacterium RBG-1]OGC86165.1 MAG: hypothetical protein A2V73_07595 [candidate division Zixibacteria bacterium RBG_19FT_COMBO_42_43]
MEWEKVVDKGDNVFDIPYSWLSLHYYEALTVLFKIENGLRIFVYTILKNELLEKWAELSITSDDADKGTIKSIAEKRINQAKGFGYLGYTVTSPLMLLTSGELIRLITSDSYWKYFNKYFKGRKEIIKNKLEEIGQIRNSLAHFRPISTGDVEVVKQNANQVLTVIETCISEMVNCRNIVPTNTGEDWYTEIRGLDTDNCTLSFSQSVDEQWVKINIQYKCPCIKTKMWGNYSMLSSVLNIKSPAILKEFPKLCNLIIFLSESVSSDMGEGLVLDIRKEVQVVLSRQVLNDHYIEIKNQIKEVLLTISQQTQLITQDNLAKGKIVEVGSATATRGKSGEYEDWHISTDSLALPVKEDDPPEYWGNFSLLSMHFISGTDKYPWMPVAVCPEYDVLF